MFEGMERAEIEHEGTLLRGYAALPDRSGPSPAVLVMHSALGIAHAVNQQTARNLAERGYLAVCTDMYGAHLEGAPIEDAGIAYAENHANPDKQRARTVAWLDGVAARPDGDADRVAAVGPGGIPAQRRAVVLELDVLEAFVHRRLPCFL